MYRALDPSIREIRVLEILPSNLTDPRQTPNKKVAVQLLYCSLDKPILYEALSYTWGDPKKQTTITVDSTDDVLVRQNLAQALHDLQLPDRSRCVWVDALCINQADLAERSEQVRMMRDVYATASVVCSWLDLSIDATKEAFTRLNRFTNDTFIEDLGSDPAFWNPVAEVFKNEYWSRIWVQQEIAYAGQWTIQCRSDIISELGLLKLATLLVLKG
jgi:hypothetical protein